MQRGCDQGRGSACYQLGLAYYEGKDDKGQPVDLDLYRARRSFERACERDEGHACASLGDMLNKGEGGAADKTRAVSLYRRGCELGAGAACARAALAYREGSSVPRNIEQAATSAKQGCARGDKPSCDLFKELATMADSGGAGMTAEVRQLMEQCDAGNTGSCFELGVRYDEGKGVAADKPKAAATYKTLCEKGELRACHNYGIMLVDGEGIPRNVNLGVRLLDLGCTKGLTKSCEVLVSKMNKACVGNDGDACTLVGRFLIKGDKGVEVNLVKGVEYLRRGCKIGDKDGCEDLRKLGLDP